MTVPGATLDPFASALSHVTDPFARGAATQALAIEAATAGLSNVQGYSFNIFQTRYGVQTADLAVSYILTLLAAVGDEPATIDIAYVNDRGAGTAGHWRGPRLSSRCRATAGSPPCRACGNVLPRCRGHRPGRTNGR